jgi:hypothetical protein
MIKNIMKKFIISFAITISIFCCSEKQEEQKEITEVIPETNQTKREDPLNLFNSEKMNSIDLLEALDFIGVQIHKADLGEFDKRRNLLVLIEEFENGVLKTTDTIASIDNEYYETNDENERPTIGLIDQLKIFTKTNNEKSELNIKTYNGLITKEVVELKKVDDDQFFLWIKYKESTWKANKKVPLMVFASSWFDENINNYRFCGIAKLTENTEATDELLENSPNYLMLSYKVLD